jgi:hypothetical protein
MIFVKRFYGFSVYFAAFMASLCPVFGGSDFGENPVIMVSYQEKLDDASVLSHKQNITGFSQSEENNIRAVCARVQDYYVSKGFDKVGPVDCNGEGIDSLSDKMTTLIDVMTRWTGYRKSTDYCAHFYPVPCPEISVANYSKSFQSSFYDLTKKDMPRPEMYISGIAGKCMKSNETGLGYGFGADAYLTVYGDSDIPHFDNADVDIVSFCFYPVYEKQMATVGFTKETNNDVSGVGTKESFGGNFEQQSSGAESATVTGVSKEIVGNTFAPGAEPEKNRKCCGVEDGGNSCSKSGIWPSIRARYKQMIQDSWGADCNAGRKTRRLADLCIKSGEVCKKYDGNEDWTKKSHTSFINIESQFQLLFRNANDYNISDSKWDDYIKAMGI